MNYEVEKAVAHEINPEDRPAIHATYTLPDYGGYLRVTLSKNAAAIVMSTSSVGGKGMKQYKKLFHEVIVPYLKEEWNYKEIYAQAHPGREKLVTLFVDKDVEEVGEYPGLGKIYRWKFK